MTTTLFNLETLASRAIRDPENNIFKLPEIDDMINSGIDALADFYPKEVVDSSITIVDGQHVYPLPATMTSVYRVDIYTPAGTYYKEQEKGVGRGANSGWENQAGSLYLPPSYPIPAGYTLTLFGYGPYTRLVKPNDDSGLPNTAIAAVMVYVQREAYDRLQLDRVLFQQWQANPANSDVSLLQLFRIQSNWHQRWDQERTRLRAMRKRR